MGCSGGEKCNCIVNQVFNLIFLIFKHCIGTIVLTFRVCNIHACIIRNIKFYNLAKFIKSMVTFIYKKNAFANLKLHNN